MRMEVLFEEWSAGWQGWHLLMSVPSALPYMSKLGGANAPPQLNIDCSYSWEEREREREDIDF